MPDVLSKEQRTFECSKSGGWGSPKRQHQSSEWLVPWKVQSTQQFLQGTQRHSVLCSHIAPCSPEIGRFFLGHCEASYSGTVPSSSTAKQKRIIHWRTSNPTFTNPSLVYNRKTRLKKPNSVMIPTNRQTWRGAYRNKASGLSVPSCSTVPQLLQCISL